MMDRRKFMATGAAIGTITVLPFRLHAQDSFAGDSGEIVVHPVSHASFVMETPNGVIYCDPVGEASAYSDFPAPDLILITHEHGDHYAAETLAALVGDGTQIIANPAVFDMMPENLQARATAIGNGQTADWGAVKIDAIPAYNMTDGRLDFHPEGRDNGYVLTVDGRRIYISGDTEDIPEMRALENIDVAFVCMNLPFTMDATQAASAVAEFAPTVVYPYHYRGRDGGTQDPAAFAALLAEAEDGTEVKFGNWYA